VLQAAAEPYPAKTIGWAGFVEMAGFWPGQKSGTSLELNDCLEKFRFTHIMLKFAA